MTSKRSAPRDLKAVIAKLGTLYPLPKPMTDPLAIIVWDNIGYLIDDVRRAQLHCVSARQILCPSARDRAVMAAEFARLFQ
jgi:hypothetical protein